MPLERVDAAFCHRGMRSAGFKEVIEIVSCEKVSLRKDKAGKPIETRSAKGETLLGAGVCERCVLCEVGTGESRVLTLEEGVHDDAAGAGIELEARGLRSAVAKCPLHYWFGTAAALVVSTPHFDTLPARPECEDLRLVAAGSLVTRRSGRG